MIRHLIRHVLHVIRHVTLNTLLTQVLVARTTSSSFTAVLAEFLVAPVAPGAPVTSMTKRLLTDRTGIHITVSPGAIFAESVPAFAALRGPSIILASTMDCGTHRAIEPIIAVILAAGGLVAVQAAKRFRLDPVDNSV